MRLSVEAGCRQFLVGLTATALAGCGLVGGGNHPDMATAIQPARSGPAADYPMVLGDPYTIDGVLYTPVDTLNYDVVGYAAVAGGEGITLAHRTLPLPSYVEVTSLASGKTILARVERRGPMTGDRFVALSAAAAAQLGADEGAAVRVRRVNPPEKDRAELRAGRPAPERMETPKSLVEVLRRRLPESGAASLRAPVPDVAAIAAAVTVSPSAPSVTPSSRAVAGPPAAAKSTTAFPLLPLAGSGEAAKPVVVARAEAEPAAASRAKAPSPKSAETAPVSAGEGFVIQAATFSVRENAEKVAQALGGFISPSGRFYRVRTGPFENRGQAEAALAKVRAAGYSDARVYSAG
ncbi:SPOR domain-containing protein [Tsuneonella sp. YG55]|uniref:SPOR domain-containing protein n=1 Tax=Tsuneonella litorea TaxID=2976475 RepID=A0A9X3AMM0_9SPHN|nr:SPOR domain-containing protein [Tsuneonella litorea]MCT2558632.1 SPOR domain-containing protein [Tsuneonella litorea]